jgi:hypothetical protein
VARLCALGRFAACAALFADLGCKSRPNPDDEPPRSEPWLNPLAVQSGNAAGGAAAGSPVVGANTAYHKVNETVQLSQYEITLGQIKICTIEPYLNPKSGSTVFGVEVTLTGKGPAQVPSNPFYATLVGQDGARYAATLAGCKPELNARSLDKGDRAQGFVSFVVPEGQGHWKFLYRPSIIGGAEEEARFDLDP